MLSIVIMGLSSCDRPTCTNQDPIFDRYSYSSQEYKQELAARIDQQGMEELNYWFDGHVQLSGIDYILVKVQNDSLCATAMMLVKDRSKLELIEPTGGSSYKGAELRGLSFDMVKGPAGVEFIYRSLDRIVD